MSGRLLLLSGSENFTLRLLTTNYESAAKGPELSVTTINAASKIMIKAIVYASEPTLALKNLKL